MYVGEKNPVQLCTNETYFPDDASGRPKKEKRTAGRNKFLEIDLPSYPPSVSAWAGALENVRSRVSEEDRATISFESYSVPDPAMFAHSDHGGTFMKHWLTTRESWIWRVTRGSTDDPSRKALPSNEKSGATYSSLDSQTKSHLGRALSKGNYLPLKKGIGGYSRLEMLCSTEIRS